MKNFIFKKVNIFGNNITDEKVIRNNLEVDEGDPFNEILFNKSINNLKALNILKMLNKIIDGTEKIKNIKYYC